MTSVLLIHPYFHPRPDWSNFRFPPLGPAYIAATLRKAGFAVKILDCTFSDKKAAIKAAVDFHADITGVYCMVGLRENAVMFAKALKGKTRLLVAGGPLPTLAPASFLEDFDIVAAGEGERTMLELAHVFERGGDFQSISGIAYRKNGATVRSAARELEPALDAIPFPARDLLPNKQYLGFWKLRPDKSTTSVITTRGCPFNCDFCSNAVFGNTYRERSPVNVVDEVEEALSFGYRRIHFADDVFTLKKDRVRQICGEILSRKLKFRWECLGRVDSIDSELAKIMKEAGCERIFFGIESGNNSVLATMNKKITVEKAENAVRAAYGAGIKTGAFFMLGYPGETDETVLKTIRFATSLPLDYLSYTLPYPLPGTALYARMKDKLTAEWKEVPGLLIDHSLIYRGDFSGPKMKYALFKAQTQFLMKKKCGFFAPIVLNPFAIASDAVFRSMK